MHFDVFIIKKSQLVSHLFCAL